MTSLGLQTKEIDHGHSHEVSEPVNYLNCDHSFKSWLLSLDHKRIGLMYLVTITLAFMLGGIMAGCGAFGISHTKG